MDGVFYLPLHRHKVQVCYKAYIQKKLSMAGKHFKACLKLWRTFFEKNCLPFHRNHTGVAWRVVGQCLASDLCTSEVIRGHSRPLVLTHGYTGEAVHSCIFAIHSCTARGTLGKRSADPCGLPVVLPSTHCAGTVAIHSPLLLITRRLDAPRTIVEIIYT